MATSIEILNDAMPMSWVLRPPEKTTKSQTLEIIQGKREQDTNNIIRLDAGVYIIAVDINSTNTDLTSWFSVYLNPPGISSFRVLGTRDTNSTHVMRLVVPGENTELKCYTTLDSSDAKKDILVGVSVYPIPLANKGG